MSGRLQCPLSNGMTIVAKPTMQEHGMCGSAMARLDSGFRMTELEIYFDQQQPMASMVKQATNPPDATDNGVPSAASGSAQGPVTKSERRAGTGLTAPTRSHPSISSADGNVHERPAGSLAKGIRGWFTPRSG